MERLRQESSRLGAQLPVDAIQAAEGFRELAFAGFSVEESMASMGSVAELASGSTLSIGAAARTVSSTLNQFQLSADQAGSIANQMATTFASSALTMDELNAALEYTGAAASAAGQSLVEVNSAIGILSDRGLRASRAGVGLQQMFQRLASPSQKASEALAQVGLSADSFLDKNGDFKNLSEIVRILGENMNDLPEGERLQVLTDAFGARGSRAVAPLISDVTALRDRVNEVAAGDLAGAIDDLGDLSTEELASRQDAIAFDLRADMNTEDVLSQLTSLRSEMSEEQLATQIQVGLNVDQRAAELFAGRIADGESAQSLANSLEEASTAAELADARMQSLSGRIEYIRGSISSFSQDMYAGFKPALNAGAGAVMSLLDVLNGVPGLAKATGVAVFGLTAALGTAATAVGGMYAQVAISNTIQQAPAKNTATYRAALYGQAAASRVATGAQATYTAALNGNLMALTRQKAAQAASTASTYRQAAASKASAVASRASAAATTAQTLASNAATGAQNLYTAATNRATLSLARQKVAAWASTAATYASSAASYAASAGQTVLAAVTSGAVVPSLYAAAGAARAFLAALGPIGWAAMAGGALLLGAAVSDFGGTVDAVLSPVQGLLALGGDLLGWTLDLAGSVGGLAMALGGLGLDAVLTPFELFYDLVNALTGGGVDEAASQLGGLAGAAMTLLDPLISLPDTIDSVTERIENFDAGAFLAGLPGQAADAAAGVPGAIADRLGGLSWTAAVPPLAIGDLLTGGGVSDAIENALGGLSWESFVPPLNWTTVVPVLGWMNFIPGFDWGEYVPTLDLSERVSGVDLGAFLTNATLGSLVAPVRLAEFVTGVSLDEHVSWPGWASVLNPLSWGEFVPDLSLGEDPTLTPRVDTSEWDLSDLGTLAGGGLGGLTATAVVRSRGVDATQRRIDALKRELEALESAGAPPEALAATENQLQVARREMDATESETGRLRGALASLAVDPLGMATDGVTRLQAALDDVSPDPLGALRRGASDARQALAALPDRLGVTDAFGAAEQAVDDSVASIQSRFASLWPAFEDRFPRTAAALETRADRLGKKFRAVGMGAEALGDAVGETLRPLEGYADRAADVAGAAGASALGPFVAGLRATESAADDARAGFDRLVGAPVDAFVTDVKTGVADARRFLRGLVPSPREVLSDARAFGSGVLDAIAGGLLTGLDVTFATLLTPEEMLPKVARWWYDAGAGFIGALADGIRNAPEKAKQALIGVLKDLLPFLPSSDAQRGPLSSLTDHGGSVPQTLASGVESESGTLASTFSGVLASAMPEGAGMVPTTPTPTLAGLSMPGVPAAPTPPRPPSPPRPPQPPTPETAEASSGPSADDIGRAVAKHGSSGVTIEQTNIDAGTTIGEVRRILREEGVDPASLDGALTGLLRRGRSGVGVGRGGE
ncbi:phage tail tape measure protein [Halomarina oriensis]|nr:phage tail tape measure protein [Halomarina oriensis]